MRTITVCLAALVTILFGVAPTQAGTTEPQHRGASSEEGSARHADDPSRTKRSAARAAHLFQTVAEHVHLNYSPRRHVSGHGCWRTSDPDLLDERATITVVLQVWDDDGRDWDIVEAKSKEDIRPGCGRGKRATAKELCSSSGYRTWRSRVDVDIQGMIDSDEKAWSENQRHPCTP
jgi:hypothetical protein